MVPSARIRPWLRSRWRRVGAAAVLVAGAWLLWREMDVHGGMAAAFNVVRAAGPVVFFGAMAVLPLPLAWYTIPAGEIFGGTLTLPGVLAAALAAVAVQIAWFYALARWALRPAMQAWVKQRGYAVPQVTEENALSVVLLVRLMPGPPLFLQCCILGLAAVPFRIYFPVSWLITVPWVLGGVLAGRGILAGEVTVAAGGVGLLLAAIVAVRLVRRKWSALAS